MSRAKKLAQQIGSYHLNVNIDSIVAAMLSLFIRLTQKTPRFKVEGGTASENTALQNIQAAPAHGVHLFSGATAAVGARRTRDIAGAGHSKCGTRVCAAT